MMRNGIILVTLAAILGLTVSPSQAEMLSSRFSTGNNVGFQIQSSGWGGAFHSTSVQFPRGSGNYMGNDNWNFVICTTRDFNGDGLAEDTCLQQDGRNDVSGWCSPLLECEQFLAETFAAGDDNLEGPTMTKYRQVWSTKDADNLLDWPIEAREGFSSSGAPIVHGAETMFVHTGDALLTWLNNISTCSYIGISAYFLDFAEGNNIVFLHYLVGNSSMYAKYHSNRGIKASNPDPRIMNNQDGWTWKGVMVWESRQMNFGGDGDIAWGYHPEKEIWMTYSEKPTLSTYTPQYPFLVGGKMLKPPMYNGESARMTNLIHSGSDFGFKAGPDMYYSAVSPEGKKYRMGRGLVDECAPYFLGTVSPWTGREGTGTPGVLQPSDANYSKWLWGASNWRDVAFYSELHDVAARDTFSFDYAYMFCYPATLPLQLPTKTVDNVVSGYIQEAFKPMEHYAEVAQSVHDGGYILPTAPLVPEMTIIPGDRQVTLTWSDIDVQSPDPYYAFLQANNLDPDNHYVEYDFEGFRLYRSYVGPNDTHSELLMDCNRSSNNLKFFYVDKLADDRLYGRMKNGMKVWYALVPYDRNFDPATGALFSLPDAASGKVWNRTGVPGLYNVIPRSDASNFKAASIASVTYIPVDGLERQDAFIYTLAGDGTGRIVEDPLLLAPAISAMSFIPVNNERITQDKTLYIKCVSYDKYWNCSGRNTTGGIRGLVLADGSYETPEYDLYGGKTSDQTITFQGPVDAAGLNYAIDVTFTSLFTQVSNKTTSYMEAGADTARFKITIPNTADCAGVTSRPNQPPSMVSLTRNGRFSVTWKDAGGGNLTLEVKDLTRNRVVPHVDYPDQDGWGFQTKEGFGSNIGANNRRGKYFDEAFVSLLPFSERTVKMPETLPADNTEHFGLYLNGILWRFDREGTKSDGVDGITMPQPGSVWIATNVFGSWNSDKTVFTQVPELPAVGDKWEIKIDRSTLNPEDADLSKIKVVPNPYIASSLLDLSATQRRIDFVNLPDRCTIRIFSMGGNLVNVLNHIGANRSGWGNYTDWDHLTVNEPKVMTGYDNHSGNEAWDLRNRFGQTVASGLYFFHVTDSRGKTFTGKFYIVL